MSRDTPSLSVSLPGATADRLVTRDASPSTGVEREQLGELAAQFESMLMLEMIKQMRKSLLDEHSDGEGLGNETYSSTIDGELALHLARAGGLGLTPSLVASWERQQEAVTPRATTSPIATEGVPSPGVKPVVAAVAPAAMSANRPTMTTAVDAPSAATGEISLQMAARVSSAYGWRLDPLGRGSRFHGGIDLAARQGTEVPSAAAGTVVTAEEQGGYGLTVVVRHDDGYESRYAHLSALTVSAGDEVRRGQQVGRVGSTGRSTGPHLHFEVTQAGRRVDPERFVRNLTSDIKGQ